MKNVKHFIFMVMIAVAMVACKNDNKTVETSDTDVEVTANVDGNEVQISDESYIWYEGKKVVGADRHNGKVQFEVGNFVVNNGKLVGGEFVIDMESISNDDIEKDEAKENFLKHIKSDDFFSVETYPTAKFTILEVSDEADADGMHTVDGTLTIKGNAKNISFPAKVTTNGDEVSLQADFTIDRTDFDVNYGSPTKFTDIAKDKAIANKIDLKVMATS